MKLGASFLVLFALTICSSLGRVHVPIKKEKEDSLTHLMNFRQLLLLKEQAMVDRLKTPREFKEPIINYENSLFFGEITLGNPPQNFDVLFETALGNLFVPSAQCRSIGCVSHRRYNSKASRTSVEDGREVEYSFGAANITGVLSQDTARIGPINIENFTFIEAKKIIGIDFQSIRYDGVLGLGMSSISIDGVSSLFKLAYDQGLTSSNSFSLYFTSNQSSAGSVMIIGGQDESYYEGSLDFFQQNESTSYYSLPTSNFSLGNLTFPQEKQAIIASGRSTIYIPNAMFDSVIEELGIQITCEEAQAFPDLVLRIGEKDYSIPASLYILKKESNGQIVCELNLLPSGLFPESFSDFFVLGTPFIERYFTFFDVQNRRIGLAKAKNYPF